MGGSVSRLRIANRFYSLFVDCVRGLVVLTLRVILRANTDRICILAAATALGVVAGIALLYLALMFTPDRNIDF